MPSIFEKLTNPAYYTGAHKHRFSRTDDGAWQGAGLAGRRDNTETQVHCANPLSQSPLSCRMPCAAVLTVMVYEEER